MSEEQQKKKNESGKAFAQYSSNGVIILWSGEWIIINDDTTEKLNKIIINEINDKTNRRKLKHE